MAIDLGKSAGTLSQSLTQHVNAASRVDHGDVSRGPATFEPIDHTMRSRLTSMVAALHDFRLHMRNSLLFGVHDEKEKARIIAGEYV